MSTVFSKIISGEIPCFKIAEDDFFIAFMDIEPLRRGHVLVVPKIEVNKVYDVHDEYLRLWLLFAKPIARAIEAAIPCKRVGISFIGLEVPHAHMHLVPISSANDLNFTQVPLKPSNEELVEVQSIILQKLIEGK
jgi:histidine triad (HIT) family protein